MAISTRYNYNHCDFYCIFYYYNIIVPFPVVTHLVGLTQNVLQDHMPNHYFSWSDLLLSSLKKRLCPPQKSDVASFLCVSIKRASRMDCKCCTEEAKGRRKARIKAGADWSCFCGLHQTPVRNWYTTHSTLIFSPLIRFNSSNFFFVREHLPRGYSGTSVSSLRDLELDYPAAQESSPAKRAMAYGRNTAAFCMHTWGLCGFTPRFLTRKIRLFDLLAFRGNFCRSPGIISLCQGTLLLYF